MTVRFLNCDHPAFNRGARWVSASGHHVTILEVWRYPGATGAHSSHYGVRYLQESGDEHDKDGWSFQMRYSPEKTE